MIDSAWIYKDDGLVKLSGKLHDAIYEAKENSDHDAERELDLLLHEQVRPLLETRGVLFVVCGHQKRVIRFACQAVVNSSYFPFAKFL